MKKDAIKKVLLTLAQSQGFYGRVLESIESRPDAEEVWDELERQNFKEPFDIVMYLES
jgi:hypothetical protein